MKKKKILKFFGYAAFFIATMLFFIYITFPIDIVRPLVKQQIEQTLLSLALKETNYSPNVNIDKIELWRFSGVDIHNLSFNVAVPTSPIQAPVSLKRAKLRISLFDLLFNKMTLNFLTKVHAGDIGGSITIVDKNKLVAFSLDIYKLNLNKLFQDASSSMLPIKGQLNLNSYLDISNDIVKDSVGNFDLSLANLSIGPGKINIMPGASPSSHITIPFINLGNIDAKLELKKGRGSSKKLSINGGMLQAEANVMVKIAGDVRKSKINGDGWFILNKKFLSDNPQFQAIVDFSSDMKQSRDKLGRHHFAIRGSFSSPRVYFTRPKA